MMKEKTKSKKRTLPSIRATALPTTVEKKAEQHRDASRDVASYDEDEVDYEPEEEDDRGTDEPWLDYFQRKQYDVNLLYLLMSSDNWKTSEGYYDGYKNWN